MYFDLNVICFPVKNFPDEQNSLRKLKNCVAITCYTFFSKLTSMKKHTLRHIKTLFSSFLYLCMIGIFKVYGHLIPTLQYFLLLFFKYFIFIHMFSENICSLFQFINSRFVNFLWGCWDI